MPASTLNERHEINNTFPRLLRLAVPANWRISQTRNIARMLWMAPGMYRRYLLSSSVPLKLRENSLNSTHTHQQRKTYQFLRTGKEANFYDLIR